MVHIFGSLKTEPHPNSLVQPSVKASPLTSSRPVPRAQTLSLKHIAAAEFNINNLDHLNYIESIGIVLEEVNNNVQMVYKPDPNNPLHVVGHAFMTEIIKIYNERMASGKTQQVIDRLQLIVRLEGVGQKMIILQVSPSRA